MQKILDEATEQWGIKVERVEMYAELLSLIIVALFNKLPLALGKSANASIKPLLTPDASVCSKDVRLPVQLQRAVRKHISCLMRAESTVLE